MDNVTRINKQVNSCKLTSFDFQSIGLRGCLIFSLGAVYMKGGRF